MRGSETMLEIWTRHYDTLTEEKRVLFLLTLKRLKFQGDKDANEAFDVFIVRWVTEKPVA
jgi:hypothetical protein